MKRLAAAYRTDLSFRGCVSLCAGAAVNLCYALFKLGAGIRFRSFWFGAIGAYYLVLTVARALLLWSVTRAKPTERREWQTVRLCGGLLFLVNLALSAITVQMVNDGKGYEYPGSLIFAAALYAFYSVTNAVINLFRFRKLKHPVLSASKVLGLATALVSMLSLQTAMFASFGGEYQYQRLMNAVTGGAVCLIIFAMAVTMVVWAELKIKNQEADGEMEQNNESFSYTYSVEQQEEIERIRRKYLPPEEDKMEQLRKLDERAARPGRVASLLLGIFSTLLLGVAMCCTMLWTEYFIPGIVIGLAGLAGIGAAFPVYSALTKREREKLAPRVLELSRELMGGE